MTTATLTLSMNDYNALLAQRAEARQEVAKLQAELIAAKLGDPREAMPKVLSFARDCLTIARYAVANLDPSLSVGWPYETLRAIAEALPLLPDANTNDRDMAIDLLAFANDCERHEIRRRNAPKPTRATAEDWEQMRKNAEEHPVGSVLLKTDPAG